MGKLLLAIVLMSSVTFANEAAADSRIITQKTEQTLVLKKLTKTRFEKLSDGVEGTVTIQTLGAQTDTTRTETFSEHDNQSYLSFEVTGKNILKIVDDKEQILKEVPAQIKTSLIGGNVKEITINGKVLEELYANSIKRSSRDFWRGLFGLFGVKITETITSLDMKCQAEQDVLVCKQNVTLVTKMNY